MYQHLAWPLTFSEFELDLKKKIFEPIRIFILRFNNFRVSALLFWFSFCPISKEIDFVLAVQFVSHQRLIVSQETKINGPTILVMVVVLVLVKSMDFSIQWQLDILSLATKQLERNNSFQANISMVLETLSYIMSNIVTTTTVIVVIYR